MNKVASIYNRLQKLEKWTKSGTYPIHKKLNHPDFNDITEWIVTYLKKQTFSSIIDIGCGVGYALQSFRRHFPDTQLAGLTISSEEYNYLIARKLTHTEYFHQSFDKPISGTYDIVVAIESIKHSSDLNKTLGNIKSILSPNGMIIIVDDWLTQAWKSENLNSLIEYWGLEQVWTENDIEKATESNQLKLHEQVTLTPYVLKQKQQIPLFKKVFRAFPLLNIFYAGFVLDQGYAEGVFDYKIHIYTH